jgi:hypothetical protein
MRLRIQHIPSAEKAVSNSECGEGRRLFAPNNLKNSANRFSVQWRENAPKQALFVSSATHLSCEKNHSRKKNAAKSLNLTYTDFAYALNKQAEILQLRTRILLSTQHRKTSKVKICQLLRHILLLPIGI